MTYSFEQFLEALRQVETGGMPRKGFAARGDNGKARGPYQIWTAYWLDAMKSYSRFSGSNRKLYAYSQCDFTGPSRHIVWLYLQRYAKKALLAGDWERCARIHNGGPYGYRKKATLPYWEKVNNELEKRYG